MTKLRYSRAFKNGIITILFCFLLFGSVVVFFIAFKIQYDDLISGMNSVEATIVNIDLDVHVRGPHKQEIYIAYEVDGVVYNRELKTDTSISFEAGRGACYSVGDRIEIFYDPKNPEVIASPRSVEVGTVYLVVVLIGLALLIFSLSLIMKNRSQFLVTQEEYEKEKEVLKKSKLAKKQQKKQRQLERNRKYTAVRKAIKILVIVFVALVGGFILFLLLGSFLKMLGYGS